MNLIQKVKAHRQRKAFLRRKFEELSDPHFFTIAEFVQNYEAETGHYVTRAAVAEVRGLLENA